MRSLLRQLVGDTGCKERPISLQGHSIGYSTSQHLDSAFQFSLAEMKYFHSIQLLVINTMALSSPET